ncbi:phosphoglycerate kinase [candidate division KSB1 bacterium]|nr:phosphoglycerate kinase [candidate division KSB1 bacterium]
MVTTCLIKRFQIVQHIGQQLSHSRVRQHSALERFVGLLAIHKRDYGAADHLLQKELDYFSRVFDNPDRPLMAILGSVKISDKLNVIENLIKRVDALFIGGTMTYTFLKAQGIAMGKSMVEEDFIEKAKELLETAKQKKLQKSARRC